MSQRRIRARGCSWRTFATLAVVVIALALADFAQTSTGQRATRDLGLFSSSEPFTELYFSDPTAVAAATEGALAKASRQVAVSFVIQNSGHAGVGYHWGISVQGAPADAGFTVLGPRQHVGLSRDVLTGCTATRRHRRSGPRRVRITVALSKPAESIGYWVSCRA